jgi:hypothetical protein
MNPWRRDVVAVGASVTLASAVFAANACSSSSASSGGGVTPAPSSSSPQPEAGSPPVAGSDGSVEGSSDHDVAVDGMPPTEAGGDSGQEDPGGGAPAGYTLVWEDLFDTGTVPDSTLWSMYDSAGNGGNGLRRPSAFTVHDGMVDVLAQMESGSLVSGGMSANNSQTYGYFAFRVRSDTDPSQATDAVVLTWPDDNVWPEHGENDIYETGTGASRDPFNTFIHYGMTASTQYYFNEAADGTQWHVMAMEWTSTKIAIYRDGTLVGTVTDPDAIPNVNHHVCIQLDAYQGTIGAPTHMYVDWVRVYQAQ